MAEFCSLEKMLFRAGELRSLAPVQVALAPVVFNFSFVSPRGQFVDRMLMLIRASFFRVVSDLKPVLRKVTGRGAGCKADTTRLTWAGANSFGVSASERDNPKVFAPGGLHFSLKLFLDGGL